MPLLEIHDLQKRYRAPDGVSQVVLDVPRFTLEAEEQVAIRGTSGSGKTTFLNVIAGILRADQGRVELDGRDIARMSEAQRDRVRATTIGYVFQTFHLLGAYTALENVLLGMAFGPGPDPDYALELLTDLGMAERLHHRPHQLSVGQQQRVALARALANHPKLVLADEPTGNLDPHYAGEALAMIRHLCRTHGAALLLVSHDTRVLEAFERREDFSVLNRAMGDVA